MYPPSIQAIDKLIECYAGKPRHISVSMAKLKTIRAAIVWRIENPAEFNAKLDQ